MELKPLRRVYGEHGHITVYAEQITYYKKVGTAKRPVYQDVASMPIGGRQLFVVVDLLFAQVGDKVRLHGWREGAA